MPLTLYTHPLASYCHKVLIALYEHGIEFDKRVVNLGEAAERAELAALWPFVKFPVLSDHARGRDVAESSIIIEYLDHHYAGRSLTQMRQTPRLMPDNWEAAQEVRLWDRIFDNHVQGPMQQIVGDRLRNANGDMSGERSTLKTAYAMIDRHMAGRTWVAGQDFSMADCAAVPALFYAVTLEPFPDGAGHLKAYFDRLLKMPSRARKRICHAALARCKIWSCV